MNVRQVRKKTKSVSNVKKITRSMQLVSAIKMKKSQQAAIEARPYQMELELVIRKVMTKVDSLNSPLLSSHAPDSSAYRGLTVHGDAEQVLLILQIRQWLK